MDRRPFPFSRVRYFGLGTMGFSIGVLVYGVEYAIFYGGVGGMVFIMWVLG